MPRQHTIVEINEIMKDARIELTVRVRGTWRLRVGMALARLACRVMQCGFKVVNEEPPPPGAAELWPENESPEHQ